MTKAAIISDTHDMLRPEMIRELETCDCIIHAGDFSSEKILEMLKEYAPVYAVRGNNDYGWDNPLPQTIAFQLEGVKFLAVHNRAYLLSGFSDADVIIYGHTHKYSEQIIKDRLWLNPGSCGRRRGERDVTMVIMTIDGDKYDTRVIVLPDN